MIATETPILDVDNISLSFGGLKAVSEFKLHLRRGSLHGLIGPNGAGKTTIFNLLTGIYRPQSGAIRLDGKRIDGLKPSQIAAVGISRTFQNIRLFGDLSVLDNVRIACHLRVRHRMASAFLRTPGHLSEEAAILERARQLLDIFELKSRERDQAASLPYGDRRRLEIARALATDPKLLLLDEPAAGMNTSEKHELRELIRNVRERFGVTILLIEHDMGVVMEVCERITVLDHGQVIAEGEPAEIQNNPRVIEAYLGTPTELPAGGHA